MKKFIYILIAILTFSIGFWLYNFRASVMPVSLCEISRHSENYRSKQIKIKAYLDAAGVEAESSNFDILDFDENCLTGATVKISNQLKEQINNDEYLKSSIIEISAKNKDSFKNRIDGVFAIKVEIIGEIEKDTSEYGKMMNRPFIINANQIKQISPIRFIAFDEIPEIKKLRENSN